MNINSLLESANPWQNMQNDAVRLSKKWEKSGLLEGLKGEVHRNNMALMLESQAKQLVVESSLSGGGTAGASFSAGTGEQWAGVALPLVRKVFGQIASKEFVSVQPMNLPSGLVFFLDFQYGSTRNPFSTGNSMYGITSGSTTNTVEANGGLYGAGRFGYSINQTASIIATSATGSVSWATFNFDADYSQSVVNSLYKTVTVSMANTNFDVNGVRSFALTSGSTGTITSAGYLPAFTTVNGNNVTFVVTSSLVGNAFGGGGSAGQLTVSYSLAPLDNRRGDFEDTNTALNANYNNPISIPEINVQLRSEAIVAKTRKLKAQWTPEFAQDLNAYQSLDAEAELTSILSEYISLEIDLEILDMLIQNASAAKEYWSAVNNTTISYDGTTATYGNSGYYSTQGGWFQTLGTKLQKVSNKIHQKTLRGGANFLVCSPTVATILESIPGFAADTDGDSATMKYAFGVQKVGQLNSRYKVYKNPYMQENTILMGFRGNQFLETGAVYAPYIPLIMTPLVYDPNTFTPRKGIMTRYAKKMVRPEFYGIVYCSGLNTL